MGARFVLFFIFVILSVGCGGDRAVGADGSNGYGDIHLDAGDADGANQDGGSAAACTPGMDQTCNDNPSVSALWGRCKMDGTCHCEAGFIVKSSTGRCTPSPSGSYLLWQGSFRDTAVGAVGAALEVFADGTVNLWAGTTGLQPHATDHWSTQLSLPTADVMQLFTLLANVDFGILPHEGTEVDCKNRLYLELNPQAPPTTITYKSANNLRPEMDAVYRWMEQHLATATAILLPDGYSCGSSGTSVGNYCATDAECGDGHICHNVNAGSAWVPDGYCMIAGAYGGMASCVGDDGTCPAGTLCSPMPWSRIPGVCMRACQDNGDCRTGYACDVVYLFWGEAQSPKSSGKVCWTESYWDGPP
jgi:hypothetical protein